MGPSTVIYTSRISRNKWAMKEKVVFSAFAYEIPVAKSCSGFISLFCWKNIQVHEFPKHSLPLRIKTNAPRKMGLQKPHRWLRILMTVFLTRFHGPFQSASKIKSQVESWRCLNLNKVYFIYDAWIDSSIYTLKQHHRGLRVRPGGLRPLTIFCSKM